MDHAFSCRNLRFVAHGYRAKKHVKTQHVTALVPHYKNKSNVLILWIIIRFFLIIGAGTPPNPNVMNVP
ncbi:TPA: hypothetical protein I7721_02845 [Vibrio vulnificus]|nr:hypothetical protein [Vibrio vulnificus]